MGIIKFVVFTCIFTAMGFSMGFRHLVFNGNSPKNMGQLPLAKLVGDCHRRGGPGVQFRDLGVLSLQDKRKSSWAVTDSKGNWRYVEWGTHFWIHKSCVKILPKPQP